MKLSRQIFLAFTVVIFFSVIDSYTNYLLSRKVTRNINFLSRSEAIIRNSSKLHKTIIEMQSGFRGFLLTSDTSFLQSYYSGKKSLDPLFTEQRKMLEDKKQIDILTSIENIHDQWIDYANSLIDAKSKGDTSSTYHSLFENKLKKQVGKKMNDQI